MKKLLVHVGYPKAASTSLQNGLFLELHKKNAIHFLGRAWESEFFGAKKTKKDYKIWLKYVYKYGDYLYNNLGVLSDNNVNLLSEGLFMQRERLTEEIRSPEMIERYFSPHVDNIKIVVIIRKQQELIPSYYVQTYRRQKEKRFADFLGFQMDEKWSREGKIFNFKYVLDSYAKVFGRDNIHVILFEDFVKNRERFSHNIANAFGLKKSMIEENLGQSHLNKTRKESDKLVVRKFDQNSFRGKLFDRVNRLSPKLADSLRVRLPAVSEDEKRAIFEFFKSSNIQLTEDFPSEKEAMQRHGYF